MRQWFSVITEVTYRNTEYVRADSPEDAKEMARINVANEHIHDSHSMKCIKVTGEFDQNYGAKDKV